MEDRRREEEEEEGDDDDDEGTKHLSRAPGPAKVPFHAFIYPDFLPPPSGQSHIWEIFCLLVTQTHQAQHM